MLEPGAPRPRIVVAPTIAELVAMVRESLGIRVVGIDIPIGLPDNTIRQADVLARKALPGKSSSIFSTLTRAAYAAAPALEADDVNRGLVGQGVGAQAFALRDKIIEVDAWLRTRPTVTVLEVHPEVSFATMAGAPILASKKTDEGRAQRLDALAAAGIARPSVLEGQGYAADDVLDACAVAWTAARHAGGLAARCPTRRRSSPTASRPPSGPDRHRAGGARCAQPATAARRAPAVVSQPGWMGWTNSATSRPGVPTGTSHAFELSATTCGSRPWTRPPHACLTVPTKW